MDISLEIAREKLERWTQDASDLLLWFRTGTGSGGIIGGRLESVGETHAIFNIKPAPGFIWIQLGQASFTDEPAMPETITFKYPGGGDCKLQKRTVEEWADVITDVRHMIE